VLLLQLLIEGSNVSNLAGTSRSPMTQNGLLETANFLQSRPSKLIVSSEEKLISGQKRLVTFATR
jgi:hypothetical protein